MQFDPRTQAALREVGPTTAEIETASDSVVAAVRADADSIGEFFADHEQLVSDTHSDESIQTHPSVDLYTHGGGLRGWLSLDGWGAYVEDGRVLSESVVELSLGPTVHDRVRFATDREAL